MLQRARTPTPFRKYSRDIHTLSLFVGGIVILLSLHLGGHALALGAFLHGALGWGAPALGMVLVLTATLQALEWGPAPGAETRGGIVVLSAGLMALAGLFRHGGDLGDATAAAVLGLLHHLVGASAAYPCAQVLVWALNVLGVVMVTDRPLTHWLRVIISGGRTLSSRTPRPRLPFRRSDSRQVLPLLEPVVTDNSRTRRRRPASVSAADAAFSPAPSLGRPGAETELEEPERPTVIRGEKSRSGGRGKLAAALEALLPPPLAEQTGGDPFAEGSAGSLYSETPSTGRSLEAAMIEDGLVAPEPEALEELDTAAPVKEKRRERAPERPQAPLYPDLQLPPASLLGVTGPPPKKTEDEARATVMVLEQTLKEFNVSARVVEIAEGPTLTRYEIQLAPGILVKKIKSLADNIAMALAAIDVRVEAPIPGKSAIGVEVPKRNPGIVGLRELVDTPEFRKAPRLTFALGRDVTGAPQYADLARMPHMLIAGSTGSGKSACLNTLITSLLYRTQPEDLRFVMIDPKRVELSLYDGIPHLCHQIVRDSRRAPQALGRVMAEMDRRYLLLQHARTRDIVGYNAKVETHEKLPYIVVVIDELADLMMTSGAETEHAITRLAQLARAVGIHLVVATQRPSVDIVTGKIKANIPSRIAFAVSSGVDSRTILDTQGAERLIGRGDMLFIPIDASKPVRIQGAYIGESELEQVVEFWKSRGAPDFYLEHTPLPDQELHPTGDAEDELYTEAVRVVITAGQASTSMIQRKLKIGYNRAATLIELMEEHGVVGPQDGVRPREVLISQDQWDLVQEAGSLV